jgi:hypothetical protein
VHVNVILYSGLRGGGGGGIVVLYRKEVVGRKAFRDGMRDTKGRRVIAIMAEIMVLGGIIISCFSEVILFSLRYWNDMSSKRCMESGRIKLKCHVCRHAEVLPSLVSV